MLEQQESWWHRPRPLVFKPLIGLRRSHDFLDRGWRIVLHNIITSDLSWSYQHYLLSEED
jgi:hypothetical protein